MSALMSRRILFKTVFLGLKPFVFDRAKMLVGDPTATLQTTPGVFGDDFFLPSDLDGVLPPPPGDPNHFVAVTGGG